MTTLADLNALPSHAIKPLFAACCGAPAWVSAMVACRPFESLDEMQRTSDEICAQLSSEQWLVAFAHHPRLGETHATAAVTDAAQAWSEGEQRTAADGDEELRRELAEAQRLYEMRFGYIFIICASGRSAAEILSALRARMPNAPDAELRAAAGEQRKITRLRLAKLVGQSREADE